jgi:hypothetical protein
MDFCTQSTRATSNIFTMWHNCVWHRHYVGVLGQWWHQSSRCIFRRDWRYEYWKHTQLIIDVVPGWGGMSLESPEGVRFLTRSRLFTYEEWEMVQHLNTTNH